MTLQTPFAVIANLLFLCRKQVGIVAGDACEAAGAFPKTGAGVHLFDVAGHAVAAGRAERLHEGPPEHLQGKPGTEVKWLAPAPEHARVAAEMALLTHGVAQGGLQAPWVDDRGVPVVAGHACLALAHMQFAGPMAALAADGLTCKDRLPVAIQRTRQRVRVVAMAEKAPGQDRPLKEVTALCKAGR